MGTKDRLMSSKCGVWLQRKMAVVFFTIHPATNFMVFLNLIKTNNPWWASFCAMTIVFPYLVLFVLYNSDRKHRDCFLHAFHLWPTVLAFSFVNVRTALAELFGSYFLCVSSKVPWSFLGAVPYEDCRASAETFMRLQRLVGTLGGSLWVVFQIYITVRQYFLQVEVVNPYLLPLNIMLTLYTQYSNCTFFAKYAHLVTGGQWNSFLETLVDLGKGSVRPSLLEQISVSRTVKITDKLDEMDSRGLRTLAQAIRNSPVLEEVVFEGTDIDWWQIRNSTTAEWQDNFCQVVCQNRHRLRSISFEPEIFIPSDNTPGNLTTGWDFTYAGRLEEVFNGAGAKYNFSATYPPSKLRKAVMADDPRCTKESLEHYKLKDNLPKCPQAPTGKRQCTGCWASWDSRRETSASGAAPHPEEDHPLEKYDLPAGGQCDHCQRPIPGPSYSYGCHKRTAVRVSQWFACNYDFCQDCYLFAQTVENMAIFACKCNSWRALAVMIADDPKRLQLPDLLKDAASHMAEQCLLFLLGFGADPNLRGSNGHSPLYAAALMGYEAGVRILLGHKANPNMENGDASANRPLHAAAICNASGTAGLLLRHRADINAGNRKGSSPLHLCAYWNASSTACSLLAKGADKEQRDAANDMTPLAMAAKRDNAEGMRPQLDSQARIDNAFGGRSPVDTLKPEADGRGEYSRTAYCLALLEAAAAKQKEKRAQSRRGRGLTRPLRWRDFFVTSPGQAEIEEVTRKMAENRRMFRHALCRVTVPPHGLPCWHQTAPDGQFLFVPRWPDSQPGDSLLAAYIPSTKMFPPEFRSMLRQQPQLFLAICVPDGVPPGAWIETCPDLNGECHYLFCPSDLGPRRMLLIGFMHTKPLADQSSTADSGARMGSAPPGQAPNFKPEDNPAGCQSGPAVADASSPGNGPRQAPNSKPEGNPAGCNSGPAATDAGSPAGNGPRQAPNSKPVDHRAGCNSGLAPIDAIGNGPGQVPSSKPEADPASQQPSPCTHRSLCTTDGKPGAKPVCRRQRALYG